jgi:hypothetical protein
MTSRALPVSGVPSESKLSAKELQRRIFLNTMRSVYPNSILIHYTSNTAEGVHLIQPASVQGTSDTSPAQLTISIIHLN